MHWTEKLNEQKDALKRLRKTVNYNEDICAEYSAEIIDTINTLIGRINCELTDDDTALAVLAKQDGLTE